MRKWDKKDVGFNGAIPFPPIKDAIAQPYSSDLSDSVNMLGGEGGDL